MKKLLSFFIVLVMLFGLISMQMMANAEDTSSLPNEEEQIDEAYIEELLRNADEIAYGIYNTTSSMQTYATSLITMMKLNYSHIQALPSYTAANSSPAAEHPRSHVRRVRFVALRPPQASIPSRRSD